MPIVRLQSFFLVKKEKLSLMRTFQVLSAFFFLCTLFTVAQTATGLAQTKRDTPKTESKQRDGQHDFDWELGDWNLHIKRLKNPLTGSTTWTEMDGTVVCRPIRGGSGNIAEVTADSPSGHLEFLALRLYNPDTRQWTNTFAGRSDGKLGVPMFGEFKNGRGEFYDQEEYNGRMIMVRFTFIPLTADSGRSEQAFSDDGGKTWETNWINAYTRVKGGSVNTRPSDAKSQATDGQRDFDFQFGTWRTHIKRLRKPLVGSTEWVEYDGTSVVQKIWNGRASLLELDVKGPAGRLRGMGLRLFDPKTQQWNINWVNGSDNTFQIPMIGKFKNGRGEFYDHEAFNGKSIFARNSFFDITSNSIQFEQAFSEDAGKTWETNWIMTFTRQKDGADQKEK